jgi:hypothetical protein
VAALIGLSDRVAIGNDAGWALRFAPAAGGAPLVITSATYDGTIDAVLPPGLAGGRYTFTVEGLTSEDHGRIASGDEVRLYLFWRDANATVLGYLATATGVGDVLASVASPPDDALVSVLTVTSVVRKRGDVRYLTEIVAREQVHVRLAAERLTDRLTERDVYAAAKTLGTRAKVVVNPPKGATLDATPASPPLETNCAVAMLTLARRIEEATGKCGRGMLLIRDGELHVGPRQIPLSGGAKTLDFERGLIEVKRGAALTSGRRRYTLTLKGRPDLKPGDVVRFEAPPEDPPDVGAPTQGLLGALQAEAATLANVMLGAAIGGGGAPVELYVALVQHKLDRERGFATTVCGVTVGANAWDDLPPPRGESDVDPAADPATAAGERVARAAEDAVQAIAQPEAAEVKAFKASGTGEPPSQTSTVLRGLAAADGKPHGARRLAVRKQKPDEVEGVSYLTPFAWGSCGLVLPRYGGMRVGLVHRGGRPEDPLDIGALWPSGAGPQNAKAGDWWLILPVGAAGQDPPPEPKKAVNDLIDADGNRVIEVGELTVRVGRDDSLKAPGERPARGTADAVTIVHAKKGSSIVMKADGAIEIEAKAGLALKAANDITLEAKNVLVKVETKMDVSGK